MKSPHISFGTYMNILFIIKLRILVLTKLSHRSPPLPPLIELIVESRMVIKFRAHNSIFVKRMPFWYSFLEVHLPTCDSNIGVLTRKVTEYGLSTLEFLSMRHDFLFPIQTSRITFQVLRSWWNAQMPSIVKWQDLISRQLIVTYLWTKPFSHLSRFNETSLIECFLPKMLIYLGNTPFTPLKNVEL
jgi:hypothetical protein